MIKWKFKYGDWYEEPSIISAGHDSKEAAERYIGQLHNEGWDSFSDPEPYEYIENTINVSKVNRVEIIGEGREFVRYFDSGEFQLQDKGRTLKIFVGRE